MKTTLIIAVIVTTVAVCIGGVIHYVNRDNQRWERFKLEHKCRVVSRSDPDASYGVTSNGRGGIIVTPGKIGYLCDDGITYYR